MDDCSADDWEKYLVSFLVASLERTMEWIVAALSVGKWVEVMEANLVQETAERLVHPMAVRKDVKDMMMAGN